MRHRATLSAVPRPLAGALVLAAFLAACGGGGGGAVPAAPAVSAAAMATAHVTIALGGASSSAHRRRPRYVSASTAAVQIAVMPGGTITSATLSPTAPGCSTVGGATTCSIAVPAPVGNDNFEITLLDANGNALSHGAIPEAIAANASTPSGSRSTASSRRSASSPR